MFNTILMVFFLAFTFLSAESLVSTIVGGFVAVGVTQWLKKGTGLQGAGATILAFAVSFAVAIGAFVVSTLLSGGEVGWQMIPQGATQIFTLATLAYRLMIQSETAEK